MASECAERGIGQDCSKVRFPTRGREEVGTRRASVGNETEYGGEVTARGGSTQGRFWEAHGGIGIVLG